MSTPWGVHPSVTGAPAKAPAAAPATIYDVVEQAQAQHQQSSDPPHVAEAKAAMLAAVQSGDATKRAAALATLERLEAAGELGRPHVAQPGRLSAEATAILNDLNARAARQSAEMGIGNRTDAYEVPQSYRHAVSADDPVLAVARATAMQSGISVKQWNALVGAVLAKGMQPPGAGHQATTPAAQVPRHAAPTKPAASPPAQPSATWSEGEFQRLGPNRESIVAELRNEYEALKEEGVLRTEDDEMAFFAMMGTAESMQMLHTILGRYAAWPRHRASDERPKGARR